MLTVSRGQLTNCVLAGTKARNLRIPGWDVMVLLSLGAMGGIVARQLEMWNGKTGEAKPKLKVGVKTFG
jgi:hypothetical protein